MFDAIPEFLSRFAIVALAMCATAGLAWVFIYPLLSGEAAASERLDRIAEGKSKGRPKGKAETGEAALRRRSVEDTLKKLEERQKNVESKPPLNVRLEQAGLNWNKTTFLLVSIGFGVAGFVASLVATGSILSSILSGALLSLSGPRLYVNRTRKKRFDKFLNEFPNALDVITRGVRAGLPITDCIRICSQESSEPVRSEFRQVIEAQAINVPLPAAVEMMYQRVPLQETNFFAIVVSIQQKSGGNLSEILGNLSKVLRERKKLKAKVRALSQESIASASIIGSLPILVMLLLYMMNPTYIALLWERQTGQMLLGGAFMWMMLGVLVMRKMINFEV